MSAKTQEHESVYYVTVLSNFARGYDKYRRLYDKGGIRESTFPDRFFVLRARELEIGVAKASALRLRRDNQDRSQRQSG